MCNGDPYCVGRPIAVFVANSDGSHQRQLTFPSANEYELRSEDPSWSPDGRSVAFAANSRLAVVSIVSEKTRLLHVHGIYHPVWGKPGIAYLSRSKPRITASTVPGRSS